MSHCFKVYFIFPLSPSPSPCLWLARTLRSQVSLAPGECLATPTTYDVVVKVAADNSALTFTARHRSAANFPVLRRFVQKPTTPEYRSTCEEQNTECFHGSPLSTFDTAVPEKGLPTLCSRSDPWANLHNDSDERLITGDLSEKCPPEMPLHALVDCVCS